MAVAIPVLLSIALSASSTASNTDKVPQFVSITFDDNFGLATPMAVGGVPAIVNYFADKRNSANPDSVFHYAQNI